MGKYLAGIRTTIRQMLRDEFDTDADKDFEDDEIDLHISEVLVEISEKRPYEVKEILAICNRSGEATATSADHLVDTGNSQFVEGDIGKTVYNDTDETTAKVTAYTSSSDITLDTDIMADGESYHLFHYGGTSGRDLNTSDIDDLLEVEKAEWKTRQNPPDFRNYRMFGDVLTLDIDADPDDGDEVFLYCHRVHLLTEDATTLNPALEKVLVGGVVAKASLAWCNKMRDAIVPASYKWHEGWAGNQYLIYRNSLNSVSKRRVWRNYPKD